MGFQTWQTSNEISSYRPRILKLIIVTKQEKVISNRLEKEATNRNALPEGQCGFCEHHSIIHVTLNTALMTTKAQ